MTARAAVAQVARARPVGVVLDLLDRVDSGSSPVLSVLTYHRVADRGERDDLYPGLISASPAAFAEQLAGLLAKGFRFLALSEILQARRGGTLPRRAVLLTFDDGYEDFATHSWPIARSYGVPVTLFVATAFAAQPGLSFWWDELYDALVNGDGADELATRGGRLRVSTPAERVASFRRLLRQLKSLPHAETLATVRAIARERARPRARAAVLGWNELRRLAAEGVTLAPHSRTHPLLARIPRSDLESEIRGARDDLEREIGDVPPAFAYPAGCHSASVVASVSESGYEIAFTTERGPNDLRRADWLRLRRINVGGRSNVPLLRTQMYSWLAR